MSRLPRTTTKIFGSACVYRCVKDAAMTAFEVMTGIHIIPNGIIPTISYINGIVFPRREIHGRSCARSFQDSRDDHLDVERNNNIEMNIHTLDSVSSKILSQERSR